MRLGWTAFIAALSMGACSSQAGRTRPHMTDGQALMVVGTIPLVGTDAQIRDALVAQGLTVREIRENAVTPTDAEGQRVVVLSYSMQSQLLTADLSGVTSPLIVLEHNLLPKLGMTAPDGHGFQQGLTQISLVSSDPRLGAGLAPGDVTVYGKVQEVFWGKPGPGALKVATVVGNPDRVVTFAYPRGAMMIDRPAPGKRLQFFFAAHAPPPVPALFLNDTGLKLLNGAIAWCLQ